MLNRHFHMVDQLIRWPDGRRVRFELAVDITERKKLEDSLRLKDHVFKSAPSGNSTAGIDGVIDNVNPAFLDLWGYEDSKEVVGKSIPHLFVDPNEATPILESLNDTGQWQGDFTAKRKDGSSFIAQSLATVVFDEKGEEVGYHSSVVDVTEERQTEADLKRALEDLERSNRDLEQFAYVASHDLQEPLRIVASYVRLIEQRYHDLIDEDGREFIQFIVDGANRMQRLIDDLLTLSRVGTHGSMFELVSMPTVFAQVLSNLETSIQENNAEVTCGNLPMVVGDESQFIQLLQNLIANGMKFHGEEPPLIRVDSEKTSDGWVFSVTDNGIGIDAEHTERVFEVFRRLHGRSKYPGTGIGLAVCKRIVERHGGTIWVESQVGEGSTFHFTLPRKGAK